MTPRYFTDAYCKELTTTITSVKDGRFVTLADTIFYPHGGGQPHDTGTITTDDATAYPVIFVRKSDDTISHEVDPQSRPPLTAGQSVTCHLDWQRRHILMRMHTASHILSALILRETGALITGNQLGEDKTRIDFSIDQFNRNLLNSFEHKTNAIIRKDLPVEITFTTRETLEQDPRLVRLAKGFPEHIKEVRIVAIGQGDDQVDVQADGGTHVRSTREVGAIRIIDLQNKGKDRRRIYFELKDLSSDASRHLSAGE